MLKASNIHFSWPGATPLINGLDFSVEPGERVAIQAPSGAGKTTLCKILAAYVRPHIGTVEIDGLPVPRKGACPVQLIWQHPEQAVDPNMRMGAVLAQGGPVSDGLLSRLGIHEKWLKRHPHELSGGELQRFCIARALAARPRYLIADEISTMLDAVTQAQIWQALLEECAANGIGLVFVSHSPALASRIATRAFEL
jgi:peptide/nickel transport system ATP-binding protein